MAATAPFTFWLFAFEVTFGKACELWPPLSLSEFLDLLKQGGLVVGGTLPQLSSDACWPPNRIVLEGRSPKRCPGVHRRGRGFGPRSCPYILLARGPTLGFSLL